MSRDSGGPLFPGIRFARALSLGGDCAAAHGLRVGGRHDVRGVFDWLVTPLDALAEVLTDDGARLGTRFVAVHAGTSVRCGAYGLLYHHEFPREEENRIAFSADAVANCRAKLTHKMGAFLAACGAADGPLLFVRYGIGTDLPWDRLGNGTSPARAADLDALAARLTRRFPELDFRLLVAAREGSVPAGFGDPADPRVALVTLPPRGEAGWPVEDAAWRGLFARIAFAEDRPARNAPVDETLYWFGGEADGAASEPAPHDSDVLGRHMRLALQSGDVPEALGSLAVLVERGLDGPELAWRTGLDLWHGGRAAHGLRAFEIAYAQGWRDLRFLRDYLNLLTGETRYAEVLAVAEALRREGIPATSPRIARHLDMLTGHARLALAQAREPEIALAAARAASPAWCDAATVLARIATAIRERRPFSLIRTGDGEARYLIAASERGTDTVTAAEARAMGDVIWENWFGEPLAQADPAHRTSLLAAYERAVREADIVGACSPDRLRGDTGHYGYLAWQERWLRGVLAGRRDVLWTDAQVHRALDARSPFLAGLLEGQDVLGVISPHPGLAEALRARLRIGRVIGHVVPGEGRLPTAPQTRALGRHFPDLYEALLATLSVPRPGCVFLVAAGLLGKIYCARIKAVGGIALDIGALADAWMGYDTRDGGLAEVARLAPPTPEPPVTRTIAGCISMGKTGSMALTDAVREAGFPDAIHLHYLGPRALALKQANPEPMLDRATEIAGRIDDPSCRFRIVTGVRDPIARILSNAFYTAQRHRDLHGIDIVRDPEALVAWWEGRPMHRRNIWSEWFDDTFGTTFGFDFRAHPFDHARKSLRFEGDRLRLLVLRQEDKRAGREAELGWLLDRDGVRLRAINDAVQQDYEAAYRPFLDAFVAPASWLDRYYEAEVIRHFYTAQEREAFRARWSGRSRSRPVLGADAE